MTTNLTPERLAEIRARLQAATPGPWGFPGDGLIYAGNSEVAALYYPEELTGGSWSTNGDFIAHAPTDIADLLAEVERLKLEILKLQRDVHYALYFKAGKNTYSSGAEYAAYERGWGDTTRPVEKALKGASDDDAN